jgi:hypothetical protein
LANNIYLIFKAMKAKIYLLAVAIVGSALMQPATAQTVSRTQGYFANTHGTVAKPFATTKNYDTVTTVAKSQVINVTGFYDTFDVQFNVQKNTGTPGGSAKLYGSLDGVSFPYQIGKATNDTLAVTNKTLQAYIWRLGMPDFPYYQVIYTPAGTQSVYIYTQWFASTFYRRL